MRSGVPERLKDGGGMEIEGTPVLHGYHMPAEWEPHSQCWMGWPASKDHRFPKERVGDPWGCYMFDDLPFFVMPHGSVATSYDCWF